MSLENEYSIEHTRPEEVPQLVECIEATATETEFHTFVQDKEGKLRFFLTPEEIIKDMEERRPKSKGIYLVAKVRLQMLFR